MPSQLSQTAQPGMTRGSRTVAPVKPPISPSEKVISGLTVRTGPLESDMELTVESSPTDRRPGTDAAPARSGAVPVAAAFRTAARLVRRLDCQAKRSIELLA